MYKRDDCFLSQFCVGCLLGRTGAGLAVATVVAVDPGAATIVGVAPPAVAVTHTRAVAPLVVRAVARSVPAVGCQKVCLLQH